MFNKKIDAVTLLILGCAAIIFLIAGGLLLNTYVFRADEARSGANPLSITLNPTVRANITNVPLATPLSDADASDLMAFQLQVLTCGDYSSERHSQMVQHIEWLIDPSGIPVDIISAFGENVQATLVYGMANYTSIQWRLLDRPSDSCLVEIGQQLNVMLIAFDQVPLGIYDDVSP
jgi:hypothetical protein